MNIYVNDSFNDETYNNYMPSPTTDNTIINLIKYQNNNHKEINSLKGNIDDWSYYTQNLITANAQLNSALNEQVTIINSRIDELAAADVFSLDILSLVTTGTLNLRLRTLSSEFTEELDEKIAEVNNTIAQLETAEIYTVDISNLITTEKLNNYLTALTAQFNANIHDLQSIYVTPDYVNVQAQNVLDITDERIMILNGKIESLSTEVQNSNTKLNNIVPILTTQINNAKTNLETQIQALSATTSNKTEALQNSIDTILSSVALTTDISSLAPIDYVSEKINLLRNEQNNNIAELNRTIGAFSVELYNFKTTLTNSLNVLSTKFYNLNNAELTARITALEQNNWYSELNDKHLVIKMRVDTIEELVPQLKEEYQLTNNRLSEVERIPDHLMNSFLAIRASFEKKINQLEDQILEQRTPSESAINYIQLYSEFTTMKNKMNRFSQIVAETNTNASNLFDQLTVQINDRYNELASLILPYKVIATNLSDQIANLQINVLLERLDTVEKNNLLANKLELSYKIDNNASNINNAFYQIQLINNRLSGLNNDELLDRIVLLEQKNNQIVEQQTQLFNQDTHLETKISVLEQNDISRRSEYLAAASDIRILQQQMQNVAELSLTITHLVDIYDKVFANNTELSYNFNSLENKFISQIGTLRQEVNNLDNKMRAYEANTELLAQINAYNQLTQQVTYLTSLTSNLPYVSTNLSLLTNKISNMTTTMTNMQTQLNSLSEAVDFKITNLLTNERAIQTTIRINQHFAQNTRTGLIALLDELETTAVLSHESIGAIKTIINNEEGEING